MFTINQISQAKTNSLKWLPTVLRDPSLRLYDEKGVPISSPRRKYVASLRRSIHLFHIPDSKASVGLLIFDSSPVGPETFPPNLGADTRPRIRAKPFPG